MRLLLVSFLLCVSTLQAAPPTANLVKIYKKAFLEYKSNQKSEKAIMKLALASFDAGYFKQAYDLVLQLLELKPDDAPTLVLYANVLIEYGYEAKARRKLAHIIDLYPGSEEASKAEKSLAMLDRLHNPSQKQFSFKFSAGLDSNPAYIIENDYLSNFMTTLGCQDSTSECDYLNRFADINPYVDMEAKTDYIYDAGATGGLFFTYGWGLAGKMYLEDIDAGFISAQLNYGLGISSGQSSYHLPISIKESYSKYKIYSDTSRIDYSTFKIRPHYRYRFKNRSLFSLGIEHEEQDSSGSYTYNTSTAWYYQNSTFAFIQYNSASNASHPFSLMLYRGERSSFNNDYNSTSSVPYTQYSFSGLDLIVNYQTSKKRSYKTSLKLHKKWYNDHYIQGTSFVDAGENRIDYSALLDFQATTINTKLSKTVLGYKLYLNSSNYEPMDFSKHELYLAYYWLP